MDGWMDNKIIIFVIYMNFISPNTAAQYNIERKIEIQNIQVIQKKLHKVIQKIQASHWI